jgi:hypothetical protein
MDQARNTEPPVAPEDRVNKYQREALGLRIVGWTSIVWGFVTSMWIMVGERAGSQLWLWSTFGLFVFGVICLVIAGRVQERANRTLPGEVLMAENRDRAA